MFRTFLIEVAAAVKNGGHFDKSMDIIEGDRHIQDQPGGVEADYEKSRSAFQETLDGQMAPDAQICCAIKPDGTLPATAACGDAPPARPSMLIMLTWKSRVSTSRTCTAPET